MSPQEEFQWLEELAAENRDYRTALTRILKWARDNSTTTRDITDEYSTWTEGDGEELWDALADAGFEIDSKRPRDSRGEGEGRSMTFTESLLEIGWCLVHGMGECTCGKRRQTAAHLCREFFGDPHLGDVTELEWLEYLNAMAAQQSGGES